MCSRALYISRRVHVRTSFFFLLWKVFSFTFPLCSCHPGWTGELCDECIKLPGCSRHGHCTKPLECTCDDGYQGNFCSKPICREGCHPQYGFCDRPNECWCKPGWTGQNCTECLTYPGCRNGGCDQPWECNCNPGFHGKLCDLEGDEVTTLPPFKKKYKEGKPRGRSALPANNFGQFSPELVQGL